MCCQATETLDLPAEVIETLARYHQLQVPAGIVVVQVDENRSLYANIGPARPAIAGRTIKIDVVIDSAAGADLVMTVADREVHIAPRGAAVKTFELDGADGVFTRPPITPSDKGSCEAFCRRSRPRSCR